MIDSEEQKFLESMGIEVQNIIAHGGYGVVYYVYSNKYKAYYALKKVPKNVFKETELECFKAIDDPKIVSLYDIFRYKDNIYMLMEFCPNDLEKEIELKGNFTDEELSRYIKAVILSIKACHDKNIAHSDIKPSNFLIDQYGRVKISDFGLSKIYTNNPSTLKIQSHSAEPIA